ncbi:MAG: alpha/beta hydrolase [Patescibacteria group bacterium]|nr:alpha/beta hydrolase [Patescibacteria group bacterium]
MRKEVLFKNNLNQKLVGDLYLPKNINKPPVIIVMHGYQGGRKGIARLAADFALKKGFAVLAFDRSGHGESQGDYSQYTVSQGANDLKSSVNFLLNNNQVDINRIGLMATSGSAYEAIIYSSQNNNHLKSLVLSVPVTNYKKIGAGHPEFLPENLNKWQDKGVIRGEDKNFPGLKYKFVEDFEKYNLFNLAKKINIPTLVHYAEKDSIISEAKKDSKILYKNLSAQEKNIFGTPTDHGYHKTDLREDIFERFFRWFKKYL